MKTLQWTELITCKLATPTLGGHAYEQGAKGGGRAVPVRDRAPAYASHAKSVGEPNTDCLPLVCKLWLAQRQLTTRPR